MEQQNLLQLDFIWLVSFYLQQYSYEIDIACILMPANRGYVQVLLLSRQKEDDTSLDCLAPKCTLLMISSFGLNNYLQRHSIYTRSYVSNSQGCKVKNSLFKCDAKFHSKCPVLMVNLCQTQTGRAHLALIIVLKMLMANSSLISRTGIGIVTAKVSLMMVVMADFLWVE